MSYRLVEAYGTGEAIVTLQGRTYNDPSLVEDDDGYRWYLASSLLSITPGHWASSAAAGVVGLIAPYGSRWVGLTTERFTDLRKESAGRYYLGSGWYEFDQPPTYRTLFDAATAPPTSPSGGFVSLHTHTEFSALDGCSTVEQIFEQAQADDQPGVGFTDHGNCSAHPQAQKFANRTGLKSVFGIEAYFVPNRHRRMLTQFVDSETGVVIPDDVVVAMTSRERAKKVTKVTDEAEVRGEYKHLVLLAQNQEGLRNIWAASTEAFREGSYHFPRMDWDTLQRHSSGVIASTGCLRGPIAAPLLDGDIEQARQNLGRLLDIYGDRLYMELHANSLPEQVKVNEQLVEMAQEYSVPTLAVVDSHYPTKDAFERHQVWIAVQTNKDSIDEEGSLFARDIGLYMKTEAEVRESLSYLPSTVVDEAVDNTVRIAESCDAKIESKKVIPIFSKKGGPERDAERLMDLCLANWDLTMGPGKPSQEAYIERFEHEMPMITGKGYCGYFLQVSEYVIYSRSQGVKVGPGRGSGGGSLVAYLARITGIDPVEHDLAFERFMTEGRTALPDFDVDFPASKRNVVQDHITDRYGADHVVRIGTQTRSQNKSIIKDVFRALKSRLPEETWPDQEAISRIITDAESGTAGLGLSWEALWASEGDLLEPYAAKYPKVFEMAEQLVGVLRSYGKHPAGLVVAEESLTDSLPLRGGEDQSQMITQFGMNDLEDMGYIKFDILTLRTLDTIQECVDLISSRRKITIDPDQWQEEYFDPQVWEAIGEGHTLGVFQVETPGGIQMCKQVKPISLAEFADVLTLVRPGPRRSGLTQLYLDRRAGLSQISVPDSRLEEVLAPTQGCILYQEQVMQTCMLLAGYDSTKADEVRKILGKKKVELVLAAGQEFVEGCVVNGMERTAAEHLWEQLAEFAKYSFGKAHAFGYAVLAFWTAWLKVHYPIEFYTAVLSTIPQNRIPEFISEARRFGFKIAPPDINESGYGFTSVELGVRYGLDALKGVGASALSTIVPGQPYTSFEDFRVRSGADSGVTRTLAKIGAFDSLGENRRGLEALLEGEKTGAATQCTFKVDPVEFPGVGSGPDNVCTFDWEAEPAPVNPRTGRTLKKKPPPMHCTKACRNYTAPPPFDPESVEPYNEGDIRNIEMEVLGIHLSSTVFDRLPADGRELCISQAEDMVDGPEGGYVLAVTVSKVRKHIDRSGQEMAFLGMVTERSDLDVTCFSKTWAQVKKRVSVGALATVEVYKNDRGLSLMYFRLVD